MVLEENQILELIQKPFNSNIKQWKKEHKLLDLYYNGGDVSTELERVKNYENTSQKKLRDKVARSTKDFLSNLLNPLNKVFTASGYKAEIDLSSESAKQSIEEHLSKLPEGMSITKWMDVYWKEAYVTDPNAICFVEVEDDNENPKAYPTYKSILTIHDYKLKWGKFEYVIFEPVEKPLNNKTVKVYRVFDEEKDALYYLENNTLKEYVVGDDETSIISHGYGFVPAVLVSDLIDKKTEGRKSFINKIDEVLKEYMRDSSVHSIYKFLHGFPIFWRYVSKCTTCKGTGKIVDENSTETPKAKITCPTCSGSGQKITSDVSDAISLPLPTRDQPKLTPDIAGYVQPDLETWQKQLDELMEMRKEMHFALWGTYTNDDVKAETATARFIDDQPVQETLKNVSTTAENVEGMLTEFICKIMFRDLYKSSKVKYGKRFLIETPDVLWQRYLSAKEKQAPITTLDYLYEQFLMAEYQNDLAMMQRKLNEFYLEPYPHYSLSDISNVASPMQVQKKILFSDWNSLETTDYSMPFEKLKTDFDNYVNDNTDLTLNTINNEKTSESQGND